MSSRILIIEKTGVIKESVVKNIVETELYKKAGFKSAEGFTQVHQWCLNGNTVSLYGKSSGRAGQENKYDFPPPVDKILFFGSCILVSDSGSLKKSQWETMYEELFGGFEDIGDEDSDESEDEDDDIPKTKSGYAKDGFVVDDDEDEEEEDDDEKIRIHGEQIDLSGFDILDDLSSPPTKINKDIVLNDFEELF